ncbi:MAG: hypothetical protein AB7S26_42505 [Sandaracinaceae bacterium]
MKAHATVLAAMLLASLSFAGCGMPGGVESQVTLGVGEGVYHDLAEGQTLQLVHGCQGAQHVWVALRASGIEPRGPIIDLALTRDRDGSVVSQPFTVRVSFDRAASGHDELAGLTLVVPDPGQAIGEALTLRANVVDANDVEVIDERHVGLEWGDGGCL